MPVNQDFLEFVLEHMDGVEELNARSMFGGYGIFQDDKMFAIVANDTLYLKADNRNRMDFERAGMEPFRPYKDQSRVISYYELPADLLENPEAFAPWMGKALAAAKPR
jgi:DNA transformation protein